MNSRELAILASAYNAHGPKSGEAARPDTVLQMTDWETLHGYACAYYEAADAGADTLYTASEIGEVATTLERMHAGGAK